MSTAKVLTRDEWNARAYALANTRQLTGTARIVAGQAANVRTYRVPSADRTGSHLVTYSESTGAVSCNCPAGEWGKPCAHSGAVLHAESQRAQALRENANDARWRAWLNGGEW